MENFEMYYSLVKPDKDNKSIIPFALESTEINTETTTLLEINKKLIEQIKDVEYRIIVNQYFASLDNKDEVKEKLINEQTQLENEIQLLQIEEEENKLELDNTFSNISDMKLLFKDNSSNESVPADDEIIKDHFKKVYKSVVEFKNEKDRNKNLLEDMIRLSDYMKK